MAPETSAHRVAAGLAVQGDRFVVVHLLVDRLSHVEVTGLQLFAQARQASRIRALDQGQVRMSAPGIAVRQGWAVGFIVEGGEVRWTN